MASFANPEKRSTPITPNVRVRTIESKGVEEKSPYHFPKYGTKGKLSVQHALQLGFTELFYLAVYPR